MKKLRIMHVLSMPTYSGAEKVAITIINSMKRDIEGIYVSPDGSISKIVRENGIVHYSVNKITFSSIKKAIYDIKPNIIHAHDYRASVVCSVVAGKVPMVCHLHNNCPWMKKINLKTLVFVSTCFRYKKILTVSSSIMNEFIFGRLLRNKTSVIGNPFDVTDITKKANDVPVELEIKDLEIDIIFLGRLTLQKNPMFFLEIIKSIKNKKKNLKVAMIGEGELKSEVKSKITKYGLDKCVTLYGFQKNPYPYIKAAKILCIPSLWEGFGLVAIEALALGKPVLAAPVGGLTEIVDDSCGKLCVKKEEYVIEVIKLLNDQKEYEKKSYAAFFRAKKLNNLDDYKIDILECYKQIVK